MAEFLGKNYIASVKPSPTPLAAAVMNDEDAHVGIGARLLQFREMVWTVLYIPWGSTRRN